MKLSRWILLSLALATTAQAITIAAAADLQYALNEIIANYRKAHPNETVDVVYGSSGKLDAQIRQGAPYDIFFSADISLPQQLAKDGLAGSVVKPYAIGQLVLWSATRDASKLKLADLASPSISKVAIANPQHAPYGKRAQEALKKSGLWEKVEPKLVYGENINQTMQFAQSGAADVGIVAQSLVLGLDPAHKGSWTVIPDSLHTPLLQGWIVTARAAKNDTAKHFTDFFADTSSRHILSRYGFALPEPSTGK
jgi:molybdate transport system substrate-binding protein